MVPISDGRVITLRADGNGVLHIDQHVGNNETFLLVSSEPLAGDAILGYWAWDARFLGGLLAYNRMPDGVTTVRGLPAGKLYVSMFAADNVPGFANAEVEIKPDQTTRLSTPFVAGWSDGRHDPPPRLQPLFDDFKAGKFTLAGVLGDERADKFNMYALFQTTSAAFGPLDRVVELPGGGTATVADLLAVKLYGDLQRGVAQRQARTRQPATGDASYEEALQGLWQTLKAQYPCFELKRVDWDAVGKELLPRAKQVKSADEFGLLCMQMVARLEDSHAQLLDGTNKVPKPPLPMWHPGFACLRADDGAAVVYHVDPDSAAEAAGMKIGMIVERVDDQPVADAIQQTMNDVKKYYGYSSERYLQYHAYRWFARRSTRGESVRLQGHDAAGKPFDLTMIADSEPGYTPRLPVPAAGIADSSDVSWKMLDGQVGYIYVRRIPPESDRDARQGRRRIEGRPRANHRRARQQRRGVRQSSRAPELRAGSRRGRAAAPALQGPDGRPDRRTLHQRGRRLGLVVCREQTRQVLLARQRPVHRLARPCTNCPAACSRCASRLRPIAAISTARLNASAWSPTCRCCRAPRTSPLVAIPSWRRPWLTCGQHRGSARYRTRERRWFRAVRRRWAQQISS